LGLFKVDFPYTLGRVGPFSFFSNLAFKRSLPGVIALYKMVRVTRIQRVDVCGLALKFFNLLLLEITNMKNRKRI
jgi:hypothetical protein